MSKPNFLGLRIDVDEPEDISPQGFEETKEGFIQTKNKLYKFPVFEGLLFTPQATKNGVSSTLRSKKPLNNILRGKNDSSKSRIKKPSPIKSIYTPTNNPYGKNYRKSPREGSNTTRKRPRQTSNIKKGTSKEGSNIENSTQKKKSNSKRKRSKKKI